MFRSVLVASALLLATLDAAAAQSAQPSFDCAKASAPIEHAICQNEELAKLDADIGSAYAQALTKTADIEGLRNEQRAWAGERAASCGIVAGADDDVADVSQDAHACLVDLFHARLVQLTDAAAASGPTADATRLLNGLWQLKDVIATEDPALETAEQQGRLIRLDRHALASLNGAGCAGPTLEPLAEARGRPLDADELALIAKADAAANGAAGEGVASFCLGRLFALYVPGADGSLLVADAAAVYRLERLSGGVQ